MTLPLPPNVDPHFARIAQKLSVLELMAGTDSDLAELADEPLVRGSDTFLNFYSPEGIRAAMDAYGLTERLEEQGLAPNELVVTREDAFHHRLEIFIGGGRDNEHRVMDLRIHLRHVGAPGHEDQDDGGTRSYGVMVIEWLSMQNPRATFTRKRPQLPGQDHPGTGFGRALHNILMVIAGRLHRDAILNVPEHYHLASIYQLMGYRYPSIAADRELEAVQDAVSDLRLAAAAWAVERGFVRVHDDDGERPWRYRPVEMMMPISSDFRQRLPGLAAWVSERLFHSLDFELTLDLDGFRQSLIDDPLENIDPDDVLG